MSKAQSLRAMVNARLSAAAEEIYALVESTIVEFEEELRRAKAENQRKQALLDSVQNQTVLMLIQTPSESPGPGLVQGLQQSITETPQIKEEPEEHLINEEREYSVCVKTEESPETELGEDTRAETHLQLLTAGDTEHSSDSHINQVWRSTLVCSAAQMETEVNGDHNNHVYMRDTRRAAKASGQSTKNKSKPGITAADTSESDGDTSDTGEDTSESDGDTSDTGEDTSESDGDTSESEGDTSESGDTSSQSDEVHDWIKHCPFCNKRFERKGYLENHVRTHTGETPFSCSVCSKAFASSIVLKRHMAVHNKQNSCSICKKKFTKKYSLKVHMATHSRERPYSCTDCDKTFTSDFQLKSHKRAHSKCYSCQTCGREFIYMRDLKQHMLQHI